MISKLRTRMCLEWSARCPDDVAGYVDDTVAGPNKVRQNDVPTVGGFDIGTWRKIPAWPHVFNTRLASE